ncbi:PspA/IM30 family protein [Amycolatopsis sp. GM8]|uniref:PspA/IM30 family protein n=1 Tax=Amycolatopsis sp. GM8 TaxID=2896530 RepID=UPI001F1F99A4|nr:hypothetical protein [Amycolatopsis sp. GM8]
MTDDPQIQGDYTEDGVPTFDFVRDKIEHRSAVAEGMTELSGDTTSVDEKIAERDKAAKDKLAEIRRSLHGE